MELQVPIPSNCGDCVFINNCATTRTNLVSAAEKKTAEIADTKKLLNSPHIQDINAKIQVDYLKQMKIFEQKYQGFFVRREDYLVEEDKARVNLVGQAAAYRVANGIPDNNLLDGLKITQRDYLQGINDIDQFSLRALACSGPTEERRMFRKEQVCNATVNIPLKEAAQKAVASYFSAFQK